MGGVGGKILRQLINLLKKKIKLILKINLKLCK